MALSSLDPPRIPVFSTPTTRPVRLDAVSSQEADLVRRQKLDNPLLRFVKGVSCSLSNCEDSERRKETGGVGGGGGWVVGE